MRSKSYLFLILVLGLGLLSGFLYQQTKYNFGLDVRGGTRLVYEMDVTKLTPEQKKNRASVQQRLVTIMQNRAVGPLGVTEPNVSAKGEDQIVIELPDMTDIAKAQEVIGTSARIEFYHARNVTNPTDQLQYSFEDDNTSATPNVTFFSRANPEKEIKHDDPATRAEYDAIVRSWGEPIVSGDELSEAKAQASDTGGYQPLMLFSRQGAAKMEKWTRKWSNRTPNLASVLDGRVLSIAHVRPGSILSDNAVIEGTFSVEYVKGLTSLLNAGALPVDLIPLSSEQVDPTIGATALDKIVATGLIAFGITVVFLIGYYAFPGFVAAIALLLYVLFTLTALKLMGATFSLAAIAGFILGIGMAVDANVLVFERLREEMRAGKSLQSAIQLGFRRALPAIVDSNACTILTSLVLLNLGTGPVKGFATTLIIGVLISLFTAVTVTRSLLVFFVGSGVAANEKLFAVERNWFAGIEKRADERPLQIVNNAKKWFAVSVVSILITLPFMFIGGLKPNVEFRGGSEAVFALPDSNVTGPQLIANLEKAGYEGANVKFGSFTPQNLVVSAALNTTLKGLADDQARAEKIRTEAGLDKSKVTAVETVGNDLIVTLDSAGAQSPTQIDARLEAAGFTGSTVSLVNRAGDSVRAVYVTLPPNEKLSALKTVDEKKAAVATAAGLDVATNNGFTEIGPTVQKETLRNAILGVVLSSVFIILYLAFRFGIGLGGFAAGLRFGISAIGALVHDVLFVIGITAFVGYLMGWEISALFITSMLTVIGFSVHDTIVIFDRMRENLHHIKPGEDLGHLMNRSITQSFARSLNTSLTVIVTLVILLIFGTATPDLKLFCATMLAGILSGTYSSIYNASPILYLWDLAAGKRKGPHATIVGIMKDAAERTAVITTRASSEAVPTTTQAPDASGRTYGQVRRRASDAAKKANIELDD